MCNFITLSMTSMVYKLTVKVQKRTGLSSALMQTWMSWMSMSLRKTPHCLFFILKHSSSSPDPPFHTQWEDSGMESLKANQTTSLHADLKCAIRCAMQTAKTNKLKSSWSQTPLEFNLLNWLDLRIGGCNTPEGCSGWIIQSGHCGQSSAVLVSPEEFIVTTAEPNSLLAKSMHCLFFQLPQSLFKGF